MLWRIWTWAIPLLGAVAVLAFVLATTPPGFGSVPDVLLGTARGVNADAAAYAVGAAASLALVALIGLALICGGIDFALHKLLHSRHNVNTRGEMSTDKAEKV